MKTFSYLHFFLFLSCPLLFAQNVQPFADYGFENLIEFYEGETYYLTYENNRFRFEGDALAYVIKNLMLTSPTDTIHLLIQNKGIPMVRVVLEHKALQAVLNKEITSKTFLEKSFFSFDVAEVQKKFDTKKNINSSYGKTELIGGVQLDYTLGNFDNAVRQKVNIQPEFRATLGKGLILTGRYNIPTFNDLDQSKPRLIIGGASQNYRFKNDVFLSLDFGFFSHKRFGIHGTLNRFIGDERFRLVINYGITREAFLNDAFKLVQSTNLFHTFNGGIVYRWNKFDTDFSFHYGIFLKTDIGYSININRQMEEVYVGLFYNKTNFGRVGGFDFRIPIFPRRYAKPKRFRIRPTKSFYLKYNYVSDSQIGLRYTTPSRLSSTLSAYYPEILRKALLKRLP